MPKRVMAVMVLGCEISWQPHLVFSREVDAVDGYDEILFSPESAFRKRGIG